MKKKVIFHIITTINIGGAENFFVELVKSQAKRHKVYCFYLKGDKHYKHYLTKLGCTVICLNSGFFYLSQIIKLRLYLKKYNPSLIISHLQPSDFITFFAGLFLKSSFVSIRHNNKIYLNKFLTLIIDNLILINVDKIITISNYINRNLKMRLFYKKKMKTIHYGISKKNNKRITKNYQPHLILGNISRLVKFKRVDLLIRAMNIVNKKNKKIKLIILGEGKLKEFYKNKIDEYNLSKNVFLCGFKKKNFSFFNKINSYITSSESEGFGLALLEAMSYGKPILCNRLGAHSELIPDIKTGVIFKNNYKDIANKILLFNSYNKRKKNFYSKQSRISSQKNFNLKNQLNEYNKFLKL